MHRPPNRWDFNFHFHWFTPNDFFNFSLCFTVTVEMFSSIVQIFLTCSKGPWKYCMDNQLQYSIEIYRDVKGSPLFLLYIIFNLKCVFPAPFLTTHTPNNLHSITYYENNVQSPIWMYPITARHEDKAIFFTCLNCILLIKFHFPTLDFAPPHGISL